jgi:hypothetical protein
MAKNRCLQVQYKLVAVVVAAIAISHGGTFV